MVQEIEAMSREMQGGSTATISLVNVRSTFLDEFRRAIKAKHRALTQQCV